jgi:hypothetical protein
MTTLTARHVKTPRKHYDCDWCGRSILGSHLYLYGMGDPTDRPFALRLHIGCVHGGRDEKVKAVLAAIESEAIHELA